VTEELLREVMPSADHFSDRSGEPPVYRGYGVDPASGEEMLLGYAFLTSDIPPEAVGYLAPIQVLVGMDLDGRLTGVRVIWHREPLTHSRRDFMEDPRYLGQFGEKHVADPFRLQTDLRGISGATVSVEAMSRGIRNAARRVASNYLVPRGTQAAAADVPLTEEILTGSSWFDLLSSGSIKRLQGEVDGMARIEIFFRHLQDQREAEHLLGPRAFSAATRGLESRAGEGHLMFLGLDGTNPAWFRPELFFVTQGRDTVRVSPDHISLQTDLRGGMLADQLRSAGLWLMDGRIDPDRSSTVGFGGELGLSLTTLEYPGRRGASVAAVPPEAPTGAEVDAAGPESVASGAPEEFGQRPSGEAEVPPASSPAVAAAESEGVPDTAGELPALPETVSYDLLELSESDPMLFLEFSHEEEASQFARTLARTSWSRVGGLLFLLALTLVAFFSKSTPLRWATLAVTFFFLGFVDRGFLSVSHISSAIVVGPGLFVSDLSLLILGLFTLATTLLWGRVFCGYLCPFGVLQDFIERVVPRRFQRRMPAPIHDRAILVKYGLLLVVLTPALLEVFLPRLLTSNVSLYHYVEPFGTVFFLSSNLLLWGIALAFLAGVVIVPRFYCRYVCPLGAALAVVSRVSPFKIRRVEQCTLCKVCEGSCPTEAIRGAEVDFPECVRCSGWRRRDANSGPSYPCR